MKPLILGNQPLTLEDVYQVSVQGRKVELSAAARSRVVEAHQFLQKKAATGETYYGINTGFGLLSNVKIPKEELESLQYNLLRSHACGTGSDVSAAVARAMLLLRASNLALGHSGVSLALVEHILLVLNRGVIPLIPEQGSVGASGDLAPLSHLALVLIGEGRALFKGQEMSGAQALQAAGIEPIRLGPKEGLALINGTQFMAAVGALALLEAEHLCDVADVAGSLSLEALRGTTRAFDEQIQEVRPHPGQAIVAKHLRSLLSPQGQHSEISFSHQTCTRVQDPYSLRCMPQVHGASRDVMVFIREVLTREINSVTDNPLVFPAQDKIVSGGNFHGQIIAIAMDMLAIASAELASISEQRFQKLVNPVTSELPAFLTSQSGLNSGFMIVHVAAASIVSENKTLCHPASVDTIPTSADKEDHVSMGAWAARKAQKVVSNTARVLGMELMAAAQGVDLLRPLRTSEPLERIHTLIRGRIEFLSQDRSFYQDQLVIGELLQSDSFKGLIRECLSLYSG
jgi:histidine ammonia-lyase